MLSLGPSKDFVLTKAMNSRHRLQHSNVLNHVSYHSAIQTATKYYHLNGGLCCAHQTTALGSNPDRASHLCFITLTYANNLLKWAEAMI